jgi:hypothetical protein
MGKELMIIFLALQQRILGPPVFSFRFFQISDPQAQFRQLLDQLRFGLPSIFHLVIFLNKSI